MKWNGMKARCSIISNTNYKNYGGRGVKVCDEWVDNYKAFRGWALQNGYSDELTIDRIDNDGNYEPGNCRWVTADEQARNKRSTVRLTAFGETKPMLEWLKDKRCVVSRDTLARRIRDGYDHESSISCPIFTGCFKIKGRPPKPKSTH
jgi:hypothetical protein